jgi:4-hydroxy-tetrahydrodipicolinate reductase
MNPLRLMMHGAHGRMGQAIIGCSEHEADCAIVATADVDDDPAKSIDVWEAAIDFSHHTATPDFARLCANYRKALVIGTTGHTEPEIDVIREASQTIPIVFAPNFSAGVNTLFWLTRKAAEILGEEFDLEIVEVHHRLKKDAPSGTAKRLGQILAEVRALDYAEDTRHGREGIVGERTRSEIGMHAVRGGDVVGDHTVIFAGIGERLELTHKASNRDTFARGALRAALWVRHRPPGLYDMQDVLGLR